MTLFLVLLCCLLTIGVFVVAWCHENRNVLVITPFLMLLTNEVLRVIPAFVYGIGVGVSRDTYGLWVAFAGFVALVGGYYTYAGLARHKPGRALEFARKPIEFASEKRVALVVLGGTLLLIAGGLVLYQGIPSVTQALVALVAGDDAGQVARFVSSSREEITKGAYFGGQYRGQGIFRILMMMGWPVVIMISLIAYHKTRSIRWAVTTVALVLLSFVFIAGDGTRGPFLESLLIYLVMWSFLKPLRMRVIFYAFGGLVVVGILTSLYSTKLQSVLGQDDALTVMLGAIVERIFVGNAINDVYAIEFLRSGLLDYRNGQIHMRDVMAALPGTGAGVPFAYELYLLLHPGGTATTFSTGTYITKAFVDFGVLGVAIIYYVSGILVGFLGRLLLQTRRSPVMMAFAVMLMSQLGSFVVGGGLIALGPDLIVLGLFFVFLTGLNSLAALFGIGARPTPAAPLTGSELPA